MFHIVICTYIVHCFRKCLKRKLKFSWNGVWTLVILQYSHVVYTSMSILNCPIIPIHQEDNSGVCADWKYILCSYWVYCFIFGKHFTYVLVISKPMQCIHRYMYAIMPTNFKILKCDMYISILGTHNVTYLSNKGPYYG